ncbi:hypothetical protein HPB48_012200 [Haemaphysalis longicornis]|uniref:Uncharacterized protein n=1 Tax=Haemaphysalis longicornis TaxID=44386 RepID=A0A9J6F957_HAELO|nr:hypothetical protein HPB48_012200 [Haemaphysalis longicornis]
MTRASTSQGPLRTCTCFAERRNLGTQTTPERRSIATQANTTLWLLVSAKTQTDAPLVEAVPGEAEPDFEPARTSRVAAAVAVSPLPASFRPARCSSPRLVDEATQGTRGQDMSGDTTLASEGDEMCQTDDPTYDPSDFSLSSDFPLGATFSSCPFCRKCTHKFTVTGTQLEVVSLCSVAHSTTWESQPSVDGNPAGNLLLASGIFFADCLAAPVLRLLASINIQIFTERTFYNYQRAYLVPAANEVFQENESRLIDDLAGTEVELAGDGRFDSPGFSATYMTYSVLATEVGRIILSEQIRVGESSAVTSSVSMEKEGLKRCLEKLDASGVMVQSLTTGNLHRRSCVTAMLERPGMRPYFDIWHIAKGVKKKLHAASKRHGVLECWIQPIGNHLYWVAAMGQGDSELILSMWKSILNHVCDVHAGHDGPFAECLHEPLEDRQWIKPYSARGQTFSLESFHSVLIHFAPKSNAFTQGVMKARTRLAVVHFNENASREQAETQDGIKRYKIQSSKSRKGHYTTCPVKEDRSYRYAAELMMNAVQRCETQSYRTSREGTKSLASEQEAGNCTRPASKDEARERKAQLVQSRQSRYPHSSMA